MKIIEFNQAFCVVHSIQSVIYRESKENNDWEIIITFNGSNGGQIFKTHFGDEKLCIKKYNEIYFDCLHVSYRF